MGQIEHWDKTMINATSLFEKPSRAHHNCESFWATYFALFILNMSKSDRTHRIPAYQYREEETKWSFDHSGYLEVPSGLDFENIVVEGMIRPGFVKGLEEPVPKDVQYLRPDILVRDIDPIIIIEVKTIGHDIGSYQKECYEKLSSFLRKHGFNVELFFLISAGHEFNSDFRILRGNQAKSNQFRILLWEQFFKYISEQCSNEFLTTCLGDVSKYYKDEERYMIG